MVRLPLCSTDFLTYATARFTAILRVWGGYNAAHCSEVLFMERGDPFLTVGSLPVEVVRRLAETGARVLRENVGSPVRRTMPARARAAGSCVRASRGPRLWVYGRTGRP